ADGSQGVGTGGAGVAMYGVVVTDGAVDAAATIERRRELRAARATVHLTLAGNHDEARARMITLDAATARGLSVAPGDVVELVNPDGGPVRCWVDAVHDHTDGRAGVSAATLAMLGRDSNDEVEIRNLR